MNKFVYTAMSHDGTAKTTVTSEFVAHRILNRSIGLVAVAESGLSFSFDLSDGGSVSFRLQATGAEVIYYKPQGR